MIKRPAQKLCFDVLLTNSGGATNIAYLCTPFTSVCFGDRYGSALKAFPACTGSTQNITKQERAVSAWFQHVIGNRTVPTDAAPVYIRFVAPTSTAANCTGQTGTGLALSALPYLTAGGTVTTKAGHEAIYAGANASVGVMRHFCTQLVKSGAFTVNGTLYVERQHTIEV